MLTYVVAMSMSSFPLSSDVSVSVPFPDSPSDGLTGKAGAVEPVVPGSTGEPP